MPAMTLLTPTESHAFQSFLSTMDYSDSFVAPEWNMYNGTSESAISHTAGKESLAKATKDLMSLDSTKWSNSPRPILQSPFETASSHSLFQISSHNEHLFSYAKNQHPQHLQQQNQSTPFHSQSNTRPRVHSQSISIAPLHTTAAPSPPHPDDVPSSSSSPASVPTSASPSTPFEYYPPLPSTSTSSPTAAARKRQSQDNSRSTTNKRPRSSHTSQSAAAPSAKPALLSPSQKKANHIQSEQKRRANIRRGYEALCETIPALQEAIRLEDEACSHPASNGSGRTAAGSKGKKKSRGRFGDDGEKVDGRAGPRSENIVLQKTIDYIQDLLIDRKDLLGRLNIARSSLARGHPLQVSDGFETLWEREWTGGQGDEDDEDEDDDE